MEEESKAIQEVAKATGKAIDTVREAGSFIATFISETLEQGMGIFEDKLAYMRWERQIRLFHRSQELLQSYGLKTPTRAVPLNLAIPIIQGASLEENNDLQDKWAALLVNAATTSFTGEIRRSFILILEQLTPLDAKILDIIYSLPFEESQHNGVVTIDLPTNARIPEENEEVSDNLSEEIIISLSNLARLGCIRSGMTWGGGELFARINPTVAGRAFVNACQIPKT